jgi:hypothetical protein
MALATAAQFFLGSQHNPLGAAGVLPGRRDIAKRNNADIDT